MSEVPDAALANPGSPSLFRQPAFARFLGLRIASNLANGFIDVAIGWQVYELTNSALALGLIGLTEFLPALLLALPGGWAVDRFRRRTIIGLAMLTKLTAMLAILVLAVRGAMPVAALYVLAGVIGITRAFEWPAASALLPGLIPREQLARAVAWNASTFQTAILLGPPLAGVLYLVGPEAIYATCALLWATGLLATLSLPQGARLPREPASVTSVLAGLSFIFSQPLVLGAVSLDLFAVLFGGATALLPIFARDILQAGPVGLGLLRSAPAAGALLVGLWIGRKPIARYNGLVFLIAVAGFGAATCAFALSTNFLLSLSLLAVIGATDMVNVAIRSTIVQLKTPDAMRGRVAAVNGVFIQSSNQLGEFESGVLAAWIGTVPSVVLGGIGTLVVVAIWAMTFTQLRRVDRLEA